MKLLTDKVFGTDNSIKLMSLFSKTLADCKDGKFHISKFITYDEFKVMIHTFIVEIIELFLEDNKHNEDSFDVYFKKLPRYIKGHFIKDNNVLVISDSVIKNIYDGYLDDLEVIFHELNHFKIKYEILDSVINKDTCRIVKEMLIREERHDPFNELGSLKSLKCKPSYVNDCYYDDNYMNYSEEVVARISASNDLILFIKLFVIFAKRDNEQINKALDKILEEMIKEDKIRYANHIRDFNRDLSFNSNYLDFDEAFDILVKYNPKWLEYPQISIEYYVDENNKVKKKNIDQLRMLLVKTDKVDTREYIEYLIINIEKNEIN